MVRSLFGPWTTVGLVLVHVLLSRACKSDSHLLLFTSAQPQQQAECNAFCQEKIIGNENKAKVTPETYEFEGGVCCKCNYEKLNTGDGAGGENNVPVAVVNPEPQEAPVLDPATFQPPSQIELDQATNPMYTPAIGPGEKLNYAIIQIRGMPWELPLSEQQIKAFVYAMNNVTGVPWQYKGATPAVPNEIPFPPTGIPILNDDNLPTAPAPPPPVPPSPVPSSPVPSSPVPSSPVPSSPVLSSPATPSPVPSSPALSEISPASGPIPNAVDLIMPTADPAVPIQGAPISGRKMLSNKRNAGKILLQTEEYTKDYTEDRYEYEYDPYQIKYGEQNGNVDPYVLQPSPDPYGGQPSPDQYNLQPPPDQYGLQPSSDPFGGQPSPDPYEVVIPVPALPPPPPPSPPPSPPPPPPAVILPPNANGIWYFAQYPLDADQTKAMEQALKSAAGEDVLVQSLRKSGVNSVQNLTTRFVGTAKNGILDITKVIDLTRVEAESSSDDSSDSSGIDGATIGIIVGAVAGGIALITLFVALLMSYNRRNSNKDKDSLASQWKREREIAEAESLKLDQASRPSVYKSLRWTAAQDAGFTTMSREELDRKRAMRKVDSLSASQRFSQPPVMEATPKSSRLDSMRNALGLNKTKLFASPKAQDDSTVYSPSSAADEAEVESSRKWSVFKK